MQRRKKHRKERSEMVKGVRQQADTDISRETWGKNPTQPQSTKKEQQKKHCVPRHCSVGPHRKQFFLSYIRCSLLSTCTKVWTLFPERPQPCFRSQGVIFVSGKGMESPSRMPWHPNHRQSAAASLNTRGTAAVVFLTSPAKIRVCWYLQHERTSLCNRVILSVQSSLQANAGCLFSCTEEPLSFYRWRNEIPGSQPFDYMHTENLIKKLIIHIRPLVLFWPLTKSHCSPVFAKVVTQDGCINVANAIRLWRTDNVLESPEQQDLIFISRLLNGFWGKPVFLPQEELRPSAITCLSHSCPRAARAAAQT